MSVAVGAVLCGGRSRRMGTDKALLDLGDGPMAAYVAGVLERADCQPVVLVGGDEARLGKLVRRRWIADSEPGEGPLGGVIDAVRWAADQGAAGIVVAACDLASLTVEAVNAVAGAAPAAAVAVADRMHPSLAYWPVAALPRLEQCFAAGVRSLHAVLDELTATPVRVEEAALRNVNHPGDIGD